MLSDYNIRGGQRIRLIIMSNKFRRQHVQILLPLVYYLLYYGFANGQTIMLYDYNHSESDTICEYGIISEGDTIVFKAQVDSSMETTLTYVHFYVQRKTSVPILYVSFDLQESCFSSDRYNCRQTTTTSFDIEIRIKASKDYNGAKCFGKIFTSESIEIDSVYQPLPQIYDYTDVSGRLLINGNEIPIEREECLIEVNESDLNIVFICESQASPCLTEISTNDSTSSAIQGKSLTVYKTRLVRSQDLLVTIKYGACRLNNKIKPISCIISKTDVSTSTDSNSVKKDLNSQIDINFMVLVIIISVLSALLLYCAFILWRYVKKGSKKKNGFYCSETALVLNMNRQQI